MQYFAKQFELMLVATSFFTRLPVPSSLNFTQEKLNRASRYFSLVGLVVACILILVYQLASILFPPNIAILLSLIAGLFVTGCFHEDGFADTCDGLGGGWTVNQKLTIMKDSRIGTYGSVGLWCLLTLKYSSLVEISSFQYEAVSPIISALLVSHVVSRSFSSGLIYFLPYVTDDSQTKVKPLAETMLTSDFLVNAFLAILVVFLLAPNGLFLLGLLVVVFYFLKWFYYRQVRGFTGDILGASQQVFEIAILLFWLMTLSGSGA